MSETWTFTKDDMPTYPDELIPISVRAAVRLKFRHVRLPDNATFLADEQEIMHKPWEEENKE